LPSETRLKPSATATAKRSSLTIRFSTPSSPHALVKMFVGKVETQPTPSFFRILTRPFAAFTFIEEASNMSWEEVDKTRLKL
jgi:hypothetical protein